MRIRIRRRAVPYITIRKNDLGKWIVTCSECGQLHERPLDRHQTAETLRQQHRVSKCQSSFVVKWKIK